MLAYVFFFFFFQAEDGIRDLYVTGLQTCALPIYRPERPLEVEDHQRPATSAAALVDQREVREARRADRRDARERSEEHTSELQSRRDLVCRLLLEKKKRSPPRRHRTVRPSVSART